MKTYKAIVTYIDIVDVTAESKEQAIERIKANLPARTVAEIQIAQEATVEEIKE